MRFKKTILFISLSIAGLLFLFQNFTNVENNSSVIWYGFYSDAVSSKGSEYISQTKNLGSNVNWVYSDIQFGTNDPAVYWRQKLEKVKRLGNKAIIELPFVLFARKTSGEWTVKLQAEYQKNFKLILPVLNEYQEQILGFSIFDEPYWNNSNLSPGDSDRLTNSQVTFNLNRAANFVKSYFPDKVAIISMAYPDTKYTDLKLPSAVDWIGLDCYLEYDKQIKTENEQNCSDIKIFKYYNEFLKARLMSHQKVIVFLDAYWSGESRLDMSESVQSHLRKRNNFWIDVVKDLPVAGFFSFIYNTRKITDNKVTKYLFGLESMPYVQHHLRQLYQGRPEAGIVFRYKGSGYLSNGSAACGFISGEHLVAAGRGYADYQNAMSFPEFPRAITYAGECQLLKGIVRVGVSGYLSDGNGNVCSFSSIEHLKKCGVTEEEYISAPILNRLPSSMVDNGICSC